LTHDRSEDGWGRNGRVAEVLGEAPVLHVAVAARRGPHVTPAVFDLDGGRLWFVTPRRSVKARVIDRHRRVGALAQIGSQAVVIGGRARIVDPLTARGVFSPGALLDLPLAAAGYLGRNHRHATGTLRDHEAPTLALSRVLVSIDIRRLALLDGPAVVARWGRWPDLDLLLTGALPAPALPPDLNAAPAAVRNLLADGAPVVVGWQGLSGPLALPARWRTGTPETGGPEIETSAEAMVLAGAGSGGPACVTAERSRYRLHSKQGVLLRGDGHARRSGPTARVAVDARCVTWWRGEDSLTVAAVTTQRP
jgi:hypothetical protein